MKAHKKIIINPNCELDYAMHVAKMYLENEANVKKEEHLTYTVRPNNSDEPIAILYAYETKTTIVIGKIK